MGTKKLKIAFEEIVDAMLDSSDDIYYYIDTRANEILPVSPFLDGIKESEKYDSDDRYLLIPKIPSRQSYEFMVEFTETVTDPQLKKFLSIALDGKGAFRRFKNVLDEYPEERKRWFDFEYEKVKEIASEWLKDEEIELLS